jgi:hypothetical protein
MPRVTIPGVGVVNFPYDMSPDEINAQAQRLYAEAQGKEAPLTRERRLPSAPSALSAGHHPDTMAVERFGQRLPGMQELLAEETPSDAAFVRRGPEVGGAAGMIVGGPIGAGVGAAAGSLLKGQQAQGAHVPTRADVGDAAVQGGTSLALSAVPGLARVAGERLGPVVANNAKGISKGISALSGIGAGVATGSPLTGIGAGAATKMLTSPAAIKAAGNAATRVGSASMPTVNKAGFGLLTVKALLEALGEDPASTVP